MQCCPCSWLLGLGASHCSAVPKPRLSREGGQRCPGPSPARGGAWSVSGSCPALPLSPTVPGLGVQAGPAGLPAAHRALLPPAQHLQQGEGRGAEPGRGARRLRGTYGPRLPQAALLHSLFHVSFCVQPHGTETGGAGAF